MSFFWNTTVNSLPAMWWTLIWHFMFRRKNYLIRFRKRLAMFGFTRDANHEGRVCVTPHSTPTSTLFWVFVALYTTSGWAVVLIVLYWQWWVYITKPGACHADAKTYLLCLDVMTKQLYLLPWEWDQAGSLDHLVTEHLNPNTSINL